MCKYGTWTLLCHANNLCETARQCALARCRCLGIRGWHAVCAAGRLRLHLPVPQNFHCPYQGLQDPISPFGFGFGETDLIWMPFRATGLAKKESLSDLSIEFGRCSEVLSESPTLCLPERNQKKPESLHHSLPCGVDSTLPKARPP